MGCRPDQPEPLLPPGKQRRLKSVVRERRSSPVRRQEPPAGRRERASLLHATNQRLLFLPGRVSRLTWYVSLGRLIRWRERSEPKLLTRRHQPRNGQFHELACRQGPDFLFSIISPSALAPMNRTFELLPHGGSLPFLIGAHPFWFGLTLHVYTSLLYVYPATLNSGTG